LAPKTDKNSRPPKQVFFGGSRRKLKILSAAFKCSSEDEQRMLVDFEMPLTGQPVTGFPAFVAEAFEAIDKEDSTCTNWECKVEVEGMTAEFFDLDKSPERLEMLSAATLRKFHLTRRAEGSSFIVVLGFNTTVPRSEDLCCFLHRYYRKHVYAKFDTTSMRISFNPDNAKPADEADDEDGEGKQASLIPHQTKERARAVKGL